MRLVADEGDDHAVQVEEEHDQVETELDERFLWIVSLVRRDENTSNPLGTPKYKKQAPMRRLCAFEVGKGGTYLLVYIELPKDLSCV
jgi:hypothetical protein